MVAPVTAVLVFLSMKKHEACRIGPAPPRKLYLGLDHKGESAGAVRPWLEQRGLQLADSDVALSDSLFSYG
jgi:hypothetical protein